MNKKSTGLLLSILGVISLVLITAGVTYAFFSYAKQGTTENVIKTGTITFLYDELEGEGNGIKITDAIPMDDATGKALSDANQYFDFKVTSTVTGDATIPYEVTLRKGTNSTLGEDQIKVYLTATGDETNGVNSADDNGTIKLYSQLAQTSTNVPAGTVEKTIYKGTVPATTQNYTETFRLRMWIKGETGASADYSPYEFVLKSAATGTDSLKADDLITAGSLITSTAYYALDTATQANYERIAYVNKTDRTIYTVSQATAQNLAASVPQGFEANEQFYSINGQEFSATVNVYANATVVTSGN